MNMFHSNSVVIMYIFIFVCHDEANAFHKNLLPHVYEQEMAYVF